jgi:Undecaprenyl-phosphate galactose phosphotransferase WbaP
MSSAVIERQDESAADAGCKTNEPRWRNASKFKPFSCVLALLFCDLVSIACALELALVCAAHVRISGSATLRDAYTLSHYKASIWLWILLVACFASQGLYTQRRSLWSEISAIFKALGGGLAIILAAVALTQNGAGVSRLVILLTAFFLIALMPLERFWTKFVLGKIGLWSKSILILGASETGTLALRGLESDPVLGYEVVGILDDNPANHSEFVGLFRNKSLRLLGNISETRQWMKKTGTRDLLIAMPELTEHSLLSIIEELQPHCGNIYVVPKMWGLPLMNLQVEGLLHERVMMLKLSNHQEKQWNCWIKRCSDLTLGMIFSLLALPVVLIIAILIKLESKGPAVFTQKRLGIRDSRFNCLKFRTMLANGHEKLAVHLAANPLAAEEWAHYAKLRGYDPRLTRIGAFLRRWSLDELPQFWNVLRGDMSLVGPRPYLPHEFERMGRSAASILSVRPGVTGLWQVSGRNRLTFDQRVNLEAWYVRNWTVWFDCILLAKTLYTVLHPENSFPAQKENAVALASEGPQPAKAAKVPVSAR